MVGDGWKWRDPFAAPPGAPVPRSLSPTRASFRKRWPDLQSLFLDYRIELPGQRADAYAGWGWKWSGLRAKALAERRGAELIVLEEGFVSGFADALKEPINAYIADRRAPHYDGTTQSDLERTILHETFGEDERARAGAAIRTLAETGLSKWNSAPVMSPRALGLTEPFVLLLDQVKGDRSLTYGGGGPDAFERLLAAARREAEGRRIVLRAHPVATRRGPLAEACRGADDVMVLTQPCRLAPLLEAAAAVYTVASHAGFEALFYGTPVRCFGEPFFAGWGLTEDDTAMPRRGVPRDLESVFASAYLRHSRYLDPHDRSVVALEEAMENVRLVRDVRLAMRPRVVTVGMTGWQRDAAEPFLIGPGGRARHMRSRAPKEFDGDVVIWGDAASRTPANARAIRLRAEGLVDVPGEGPLPTALTRITAETGEPLPPGEVHVHPDSRLPCPAMRLPEHAERAPHGHRARLRHRTRILRMATESVLFLARVQLLAWRSRLGGTMRRDG